jgi:hypothetical protein
MTLMLIECWAVMRGFKKKKKEKKRVVLVITLRP